MDFQLPDNFNKMEKKGKKEIYFKKNKDNYKIVFSINDKMLINLNKYNKRNK